jgi:hypothetical protein
MNKKTEIVHKVTLLDAIGDEVMAYRVNNAKTGDDALKKAVLAHHVKGGAEWVSAMVEEVEVKA